MRYFEVTARHGHHGNGCYLPITFVFAADNLLEAVTKAQQMPGVKHTQPVLSAREISCGEYYARRMTSAYEPFKYKEENK